MPKFAVLGNAVVDCMARVPVAVLERFKLTPGDTTYLSQEQMLKLNEAVPVEAFRSGGLGANTAWTLARLGHPTTFVGQVGGDSAGQHFFDDMVKGGVSLSPLAAGVRTTEIFVLVTPDGQRTMVQQQPPAPNHDDAWVPEQDIEDTEWLIIGTYLALSNPGAALYAAKLARKLGKPCALLLGSPHAVTVAAPTLIQLAELGLDILIGHQREYAALEVLAGQGKERLQKVPRVLTCGPSGAVFTNPSSGQTVEQTLTPVPNPADVTGAGDAFAAGFLAVYAAGGDIVEALRRGHQLGRACVQQRGPRLADPMAAWNATLPSANAA